MVTGKLRKFLCAAEFAGIDRMGMRKGIPQTVIARSVAT